jgi:hypothetical protein
MVRVKSLGWTMTSTDSICLNSAPTGHKSCGESPPFLAGGFPACINRLDSIQNRPFSILAFFAVLNFISWTELYLRLRWIGKNIIGEATQNLLNGLPMTTSTRL